jgi:hypothetical protein
VRANCIPRGALPEPVLEPVSNPNCIEAAGAHIGHFRSPLLDTPALITIASLCDQTGDQEAMADHQQVKGIIDEVRAVLRPEESFFTSVDLIVRQLRKSLEGPIPPQDLITALVDAAGLLVLEVYVSITDVDRRGQLITQEWRDEHLLRSFVRAFVAYPGPFLFSGLMEHVESRSPASITNSLASGFSRFSHWHRIVFPAILKGHHRDLDARRNGLLRAWKASRKRIIERGHINPESIAALIKRTFQDVGLNADVRGLSHQELIHEALGRLFEKKQYPLMLSKAGTWTIRPRELRDALGKPKKSRVWSLNKPGENGKYAWAQEIRDPNAPCPAEAAQNAVDAVAALELIRTRQSQPAGSKAMRAVRSNLLALLRKDVTLSDLAKQNSVDLADLSRAYRQELEALSRETSG